MQQTAAQTTPDEDPDRGLVDQALGRRQGVRYIALLCLLSAAFMLPGLFRLPLLDNDESRYAIVVKAMIDGHNWLVPHLDGHPYLKKPPLFFWLAGGAEVAGVPGPAAGRLVSLLAVLLTTLLTYDLGRRLRDRRTGFLSAVMVASSIGAFVWGRMYRMDMLLVLCVTFSLWCFWRREIERKEGGPEHARRWWVLFYLGAALGTLTKGPVALVLPALIVVVYLVLQGEWRRIRELFDPFGIALCLVVAEPWFLYMTWQQSGYLDEFFLKENVDRFATSLLRHLAPIWFYAPVLFLWLTPWSALLPMAVARTFPWGLRRFRTDWKAALLWTSVLAIVVFFTVSRTKLPQYVLPAMPWLALLLAWTVLPRLDEAARANRLAVVGVLLFVALGFSLAVTGLFAQRSYGLEGPGAWVFVFTAAPALGASVWILWRGTVRQTCWVMVAYMLVSSLGGSLLFESVLFERLSARCFGRFVAAHAQPGDVVGYYGSQRQAFAYYAGRTWGVDFADQPGAVGLRNLADARHRMWILVAAEKNVEKVSRLSGGTMRPVMTANGMTLMTNVPQFEP